MILNFLFGLPIILVGAMLIVALSTFSVAGLWATRRWILPRLNIQAEDSNFASTMTQSVMVFYGLVVALIAVSVWERNSNVVDLVANEAVAIGALWRDFGGYPEPERSTMRATLKGYTHQIIYEAWPEMHQGKTPKAGVSWMDKLQSQLYPFEPKTDGQKIVHAETLRAFNNLNIARRLRVDAVDVGLPGVIWLVILLGAMVCMASTFFFKVADVRFQNIMVVLVAMFAAMVIFVVFALDRPFRGDLAIPADSYKLIYDQLMSP